VPTDAQKATMTEEFKEELNFDVASEDKHQMTSGGALGVLEELSELKRMCTAVNETLKDQQKQIKDQQKQIDGQQGQITDLVQVTDKMKRLRHGELEYWVALDRIEEQERLGIATQSLPDINRQRRKERNDAAHGGSILLDLIVLSKHLTKYAASDMEPAFNKRYGRPWREARQLINDSDAELVNVFDMRASALVLFEYNENNRHQDRDDIVQNADKILVAHSVAPMDKRKGMLQPNGRCYNHYDQMRNIHRRVIGWVV